ncbi:TlpA disulfide reductase family protein [Sphingosinithalassobacter portus]|uniref:TlpA disulfide reductase family protein n=1 Tax=Stakelama portus TaxID=2676234 RepID=UPI001EFD984B|nr:TlpA disulfide reductase family protein [Sphingosinithalassobacter portus]
MRPVIAFLLVAFAASLAGCDRQSNPPEQANDALPVDAPMPPVDGNAAVEEIGKLDRSHAGEMAPHLKIVAPDGSETSLDAFQGKPVLLNLWATWCAPCVAELPTLDTLAGREAGKVQVIALSQDFDGAEKVAAFFAKNRYAHLQPYRDDEAAFSLSMQTNLPTTILYDSQGREVWRMLGGMDWTGDAAAELIAEAS